MINNFSIFFCAFFILISVSSQNINSGQISEVNNVNTFSNISSGIWVSKSSLISDIKGSQFLNEDWGIKSIIEDKNGKKFNLKFLNYNIVLDQMVAKITNDSLYSFNPSGINKVVLGHQVFKRFLDPEFNRNSYFEILSNNQDNYLLKRYSKTLQEGVVNPMNQKKSPNIYISKFDYFITNKGESLEKIPMKKRKLLQLFNSSEALKEFIQKNDLSIKNEMDLILIFNFHSNK